MTAYSTLRTRLQARLGITVATTAELNLEDEALNAAMTWVAAKGAPQLRQVYSGYSLDTASPTITHTASTATATLSSVAGVHPGDILSNTTTGRKYLIRTVTTSGATVDLGVPIVSSMTGNSITVYRRALQLPKTGMVWSVWTLDGIELKHDPLVAARKQFDIGTPTHYTVGYAETLNVPYLSLFPAPSASTQFLIVQGPSFTTSGDVYASEAVISDILAKAYEFRILMSSQVGMAQMAAQMAQAGEVMRQVGGGHGIVTRQ